MEVVTMVIEHEYTDGVWTDVTADVRNDAPVVCDYGLPGLGPLDLVADTGVLSYELDNSEENSAGLLGLYTPGHANAQAGFDEGMRSRVHFTYGGVDYYKMLTWLAYPDVAPGVYGSRRVSVECVDWMDHAASQNLDKLVIAADQRVDQALALLLARMPVEPRATSFATGVEVFARVFDTDSDQSTSPMELMQKLARNEYGLIYMRGDTVGGGTLRFDSRHTRVLNTTVLGTLSTQEDLQVEYSRSNVKNLVDCKIYPKAIATTAVVIWTNEAVIELAPGQSVTVVAPYRDPTTSRQISAMGVVDPLVADTDFKFGSARVATSNDLNASLTVAFVELDDSAGDPGANSSRLKLTNGAGVHGFVNVLQLRGLPITAYDPQTLTARNAASIAKRGPLTLTVNLEQQDSPVKAQAMADYLEGIWSLPRKLLPRVRFLANKSAARMAIALQGEVSSRLIIQESVTAVASEWFVQRVRLEAQPLGNGEVLLWAEFALAPASTQAVFIWDTSEWDVDTYWVF